MLRSLFWTMLLTLLTVAAPSGGAVSGAPPKPASFGVAAHDNVAIEWWYLNAHVTTETGRHLAVIGSFFRFGDGKSFLDRTTPQPRAHYLIYAVTDLDKKTQRPYSLADANMVSLLKQAAPLLAAARPKDRDAQALLAALNSGELPTPHQEIAGTASVASRPFRLSYGAENSLTATNASNTAFAVNLDAGGPDKIHLTLAAQKPPMAVGGKGETGLRRAADMYYFSLTRCAVGGTVDTGAGPEKITGGLGWFDHQWGNSWVAQNNGWDWWGVQLNDGTDILFFRQRDLSTGKIFFPLATFMDKDGHQSVTKKIIFQPAPKSLWKSPKTGIKYPLSWTIDFPEHKLLLRINAVVQNQEMPILGPGGGIWEGVCRVAAYRYKDTLILSLPPKPGQPKLDDQTSYATTYDVSMPAGKSSGVAYMELVGYNSPAVKAQLTKKK